MSTVILAFKLTSKTFYMKYYADQCHVHRTNYLYLYISDGEASVIVGEFCEESKPPKVTKINQENFVANFATCMHQLISDVVIIKKNFKFHF